MTDHHDVECAMAAYGLLEERAVARGDKKEAKILRFEMKKILREFNPEDLPTELEEYEGGLRPPPPQTLGSRSKR